MATIAVRLPAFGLALKETVNVVAVALVTVPTAPLLKVTVFWLAVLLNPVLVIVTVVALAAIVVDVEVTVGAVDGATTCASCTAAPLERPLEVTEPLRAPTAAGLLVTRIVSEVVEAAVTRPVALPTKVTALVLATGLNPNPRMIRLVPLRDMLAVLAVTTGLIVAT